MSGQFEQRRLARPSYQLEVLDRFCGEEQLRRRARAARAAWRELQAARRRHEELTRERRARRGAARRAARARRGHRGHGAGRARSGCATERERHPPRRRARRRRRRRPREALAPDDGDGAAGLVALAERAVAPLERLAPELQRAGDELRDVELRLRETASDLHAFLASLEAEPGRLEQLEAELDRIAEAKRRFRCATYDELLARAAEARAELAALEDGVDPVAAAAARPSRSPRSASTRSRSSCAPSGTPPRRRSPTPWPPSSHDVGMGEGEFVCELREREPGSTGADEAVFLVRPNAGLPFAPVAETASGGELSRIALAIAAVAGGDTLVFDEIDAGIGGETANAVGRVLQRLAERAQVVTITHLPQIAALADRHFRVEKIAGRPDAHAHRAARRRRAEGRARADARRPGVPCRGTRLSARSPRPSRTSGRSSPSRTTWPTGGPALSGVEPDRAARARARSALAG